VFYWLGSPDETRGGTGEASQRPLLCVCRAPLHAGRSHATAVGQCARRRVGVREGGLDPCSGGGVGPAATAAESGAARLASGPGHPEPTTAAGAEYYGPLGTWQGPVEPRRVLCSPTADAP